MSLPNRSRFCLWTLTTHKVSARGGLHGIRRGPMLADRVSADMTSRQVWDN
jgi:hypothetical protein